MSTGKRIRNTLRIPLTALAVAAAIGLVSCGDPTDDPSPENATAEDVTIDGSTVTEAEYINFMAALTIALEEGLTGEAADSRVSELGIRILDDDDIESALDGLRHDPVHWAEIERSVDEQIELLREKVPRPESGQ